MEHVTRNINIRKVQDQRLIALAAKLQAQRGSVVSISEVVRDALDFGIAEIEHLVKCSDGSGKDTDNGDA